jgi:hypothetical protein
VVHFGGMEERLNKPVSSETSSEIRSLSLTATIEAIAYRTASMLAALGVTYKPRVLLTAKEAAEALGFTLDAFNKASWHKDIPVKRLGNQRRYDLDELKTWVKNL